MLVATIAVSAIPKPNAMGTRTYSSFSEAIDEIALARVAAGIHFRFSCETAQQMGEGVADYATANEMLVRKGDH